MSFIPRRIHDSPEAKASHLKYFRAAATNSKDYVVIDLFYRNLNTIDVKAQSLLVFNSLVIAALAVLYTTVPHLLLKAILALSFLLIIFSSFKALLILDIEVARGDDFANPQQLEEKLLDLRDRRAFDYRLSRFVSLLSLSALTLALLLLFRADLS